MKTIISLISLVALGSLGVCQDAKPVTKPTQKAGQTSKYTMKLALDVNGSPGELTTTSQITVKSVKADLIEVETNWTGTKLVVDGSENELPTFEPFTVVSKPTGQIVKASGGFEQLSAFSLMILEQFFAPATPVEKGVTSKMKFDKTGDIPALEIEVTNQGPEKVGERSATKYTQKLKAISDIGMALEGTFWIGEDGTILKVEQKVTNLPVTSNGQTGSGTFKLEIKA